MRTLGILLLFLPSLAAAQQSTAADAGQLFSALEGKWSCAGGFPNGKKLEADLEWKAEQGKRLLRFTHIDRAPSTYWQDATWLMDAKAGRIIDLSTSGLTTNATAAPALFVASTWTPTQITLVADTLKSPPWTPNRFTYSLTDPSSLLMRWEVGRNGMWALGDSLVCARVKSN